MPLALAEVNSAECGSQVRKLIHFMAFPTFEGGINRATQLAPRGTLPVNGLRSRLTGQILHCAPPSRGLSGWRTVWPHHPWINLKARVHIGTSPVSLASMRTTCFLCFDPPFLTIGSGDLLGKFHGQVSWLQWAPEHHKSCTTSRTEAERVYATATSGCASGGTRSA